MSMNDLVPEAVYDCLVAVNELGKPFDGVSRLEIQRFAFLACILSVYKKNPASEWGYQFARTPFGTPFSRHINDAYDFLVSAGKAVVNDKMRMSLTSAGEQLVGQIGSLQECRRRYPFLKSAATSFLVVPPGTLMRGLENEPTTSASETRASGAMLLDGPALTLLYDVFSGLTAVFPNSEDLLTPSVAWLTYSANEPLSDVSSIETLGHAGH